VIFQTWGDNGLHIRQLALHSGLPKHIKLSEIRSGGGHEYLTIFSYYVKTDEISFNTLNGMIASGDVVLSDYTTYYENGRKTCAEYYFNGNMKSIFNYSESGRVSSYCEVNGIIEDGYVVNGKCREYCEQGKIVLDGNYSNGYKSGQFLKYDDQRNIIQEGVYEKGVLVSGEPVINELSTYMQVDSFPHVCEASIDSLNRFLPVGFKEDSLIVRVSNKGIVETMGGFYSDSIWVNSGLKQFFLTKCQLKPAKVEGIDVPFSGILKLDRSKGGVLTIQWNEQSSNNYFVDKLKMAEFPGGEMGLRKYITTSVRYPIRSQERGEQGKVFVSFTIGIDGSIRNVEVVKSVFPLLDAEAIRVVQKMPHWIPQIKGGKCIETSVVVPIDFVLR